MPGPDTRILILRWHENRAFLLPGTSHDPGAHRRVPVAFTFGRVARAANGESRRRRRSRRGWKEERKKRRSIIVRSERLLHIYGE